MNRRTFVRAVLALPVAAYAALRSVRLPASGADLVTLRASFWRKAQTLEGRPPDLTWASLKDAMRDMDKTEAFWISRSKG